MSLQALRISNVLSCNSFFVPCLVGATVVDKSDVTLRLKGTDPVVYIFILLQLCFASFICDMIFSFSLAFTIFTREE